MTPTKTLWKSMQAGMKSSHGKINWKIGEWQMNNEKPVRCTSGGFHASTRVIDAMGFVNCEVLALVEVSGDSDVKKDKEAWQNMRIVKAYEWKKEDSVKLAIYCAEKVIGIYEKRYPNDDRLRKAIKAAKAYLENPTEENKEAAAWAAWEARVVEVAWAAWTAAEAAACTAAWTAAEAAACTAARADYGKTFDEVEEYIQKEIIPNLKEYAV